MSMLDKLQAATDRLSDLMLLADPGSATWGEAVRHATAQLATLSGWQVQ